MFGIVLRSVPQHFDSVDSTAITLSISPAMHGALSKSSKHWSCHIIVMLSHHCNVMCNTVCLFMYARTHYISDEGHESVCVVFGIVLRSVP